MILAPDSEIGQRKTVAAGSLAPLADSLAADLDRLLPDADVFVPKEKARMTRRGGRCEDDGTFLEFDPQSPHRHRCPACGREYEGDDHYRWWIMGYQLWLAERVLHAAALWRVRGGERHRVLAETVLEKLTSAYPEWPDEDNVLGPGRVFFSTYLESIWLLQLSLAVSLLDRDGTTGPTANFRDRVVTPSSEIIASFDEGLSNRQVWNAAATGAAGVLLDRDSLVAYALQSLERHVRDGMLSDGTWYEGENYHLFAHRGLWHLVRLADHVGAPIQPADRKKFELGFAAPLRTALPDFTFPARRDSQYRASLRQWRIAESLELGRADCENASELEAGLVTLYESGEPGDAARWRSTAEAERNVPGVRLTRANLGWKSLLFAVPDPPNATVSVPASALMEGQGLGVIRRNRGRTYVALDYGHSGGSHGHPDRLNLWLVQGDNRVFEDVGTGSYVEETLHWYRSTLAHNAPLIDGRSQARVRGSLRAWDERDEFSWIDAEAPIADGVLVRRSIVVGHGHLVDRIEWTADRDITFDMPMHVDANVEGAHWRRATLHGEHGLEDGFRFVTDTERSTGTPTPETVSGGTVHGAVHCNVDHEWWRAVAPGPPREPPRRFLLVRARGSTGNLTSVWSWTGPATMSIPADNAFEVVIGSTTYSHRVGGGTWHVRQDGTDVTLDGRRSLAPPTVAAPRVAQSPISITPDGSGVVFELGTEQYRQTERSWEAAGSSSAMVIIRATTNDLLIDILVPDQNPNFAPARDENPLDNEHPDVNSDGVQFHLTAPGNSERAIEASWLMVPEPPRDTVRVTSRGDASLVPLRASWSRAPSGWSVSIRLPRSALGTRDATFGIDVIVNQMPAGRERRQGQLVLSGKGSGWAWLRGDRQERDVLIRMVVRDE